MTDPSPRPRSFRQVDVFSEDPFRGNPVAVVLDADGMTAARMQEVAAWTGLSETAFVLSPTVPGADYRVRIFTPHGELPFAGHPTLGTCAAWLDARGESVDGGPDVVQECAAGLVRVRRDEGVLAFAAPPLVRRGPLRTSEAAAYAASLGLSLLDVRAHGWVDDGPGWCVLDVGSAEVVLGIEPDFGAMPGPKVGVVGGCPEGSAHAYEVRAFVRAGYEDPVTGSLNAGIAAWMLGRDDVALATPFTAHQGTRRGRDGVIRIDRDEDGQLWVGGAASVLIRGSIDA